MAGVYQGTGNKTKPVTVNVGFSPKAGVVFQLDPYYTESPLLIVPSSEPVRDNQKVMNFTATGFQAVLAADRLNDNPLAPFTNKNHLYCYVALCQKDYESAPSQKARGALLIAVLA